MKLVVYAALLIPLTCMAQTYKCVEKGKSVYSDRPCSDKAVVLNIGDNPADKERLEESHRRLNEMRASVGAGDAIRQEGAARAAQRRSSGSDQQQDDCARLIRTSKDAANEAELYQTPRFKADAKRRQKEADDEHFTKCYGTVSVK